MWWLESILKYSEICHFRSCPIFRSFKMVTTDPLQSLFSLSVELLQTIQSFEI